MPIPQKVLLELSAVEVEEVLRVVMDEDQQGALRVLRGCIEKRVRRELAPHCAPVFDAGYKAGRGGTPREF